MRDEEKAKGKLFPSQFPQAGFFGRKSLGKLLIHDLDGCFLWEWKHLEAPRLIFTNPERGRKVLLIRKKSLLLY